MWHGPVFEVYGVAAHCSAADVERMLAGSVAFARVLTEIRAWPDWQTSSMPMRRSAKPAYYGDGG